MIKSRLFKHTFTLLFITVFLDLVAEKFYLYFTTSWFDSMVHFLATSCVGMAGFLVLIYFGKINTFSRKKQIVIAVSGALVIGLLWEVYELYFGITLLSDGIRYVRDTASDLSMDVLGGFSGSFYSLKLLRNE